MKIINLTFETVTEPDFSGWAFYVEAGDLFDADDYAEAFNLNRSDIDAQGVHSAQDAAGKLNDGEWLHVKHTASDPIMITLTLEAFDMTDEFLAEMKAAGIVVEPIDAPWEVKFTGTREALEPMLRTHWGMEDDEIAATFEQVAG